MSVMSKMGKFLDYSSFYHLSFLCQCLEIKSIMLNVSNSNKLYKLPNSSQIKVRKRQKKPGGLMLKEKIDYVEAV